MLTWERDVEASALATLGKLAGGGYLDAGEPE